MQTLKALLLDLKPEQVKGIWAPAIHSWMQTLTFGHTVGTL